MISKELNSQKIENKIKCMDSSSERIKETTDEIT